MGWFDVVALLIGRVIFGGFLVTFIGIVCYFMYHYITSPHCPLCGSSKKNLIGGKMPLGKYSCARCNKYYWHNGLCNSVEKLDGPVRSPLECLVTSGMFLATWITLIVLTVMLIDSVSFFRFTGVVFYTGLITIGITVLFNLIIAKVKNKSLFVLVVTLM